MKPGKMHRALPELPLDAAAIVAAILQQDRRILLYGPMGTGKSTLAAQLAGTLAAGGRACACLSADPGSPAFGAPGALSLGEWRAGGWATVGHAALCTLDAGRFRLPLVAAVRMLAKQLPSGTVLIDAPGVVRGVAGSELLQALVDAAAVDAILALSTADQPPLLQELCATALPVYWIAAARAARRPGKRVRSRRRTAQWDAFLEDAKELTFELDRLNVTGTPPLPAEASAWQGRQVALLRSGRTLAMGEVVNIEPGLLTLLMTGDATGADTLLLRDALRGSQGFLETAVPYAVEPIGYLPPNDVLPAIEPDNGPRLAGRVGSFDFALVNGVFGDPLLHVRMRHQRRSLLFDLGDGSRLPARIAHQVTDVFISHAHMDHIGGFLWLLRSRIGEYPPCRLYGPPGLARHIAGFLQGILWDRVEENAPCFEVHEVCGERVQVFGLRAGRTLEGPVEERALKDGVVLGETGFRVRAQALGHRHATVLAYALEAERQLNIRKDRLEARGLEPGPWLDALKQHLLAGSTAAMLDLPDGSRAPAAALAADLVLSTPGKRLVYATDLGDTRDNRDRLLGLARHAHTLFCECSYLEADVDLADMNGHLTTRACGEIATLAGVSRLVPFHFSRRYQHRAEQLYDELGQHCAQLCRPAAGLLDAGITSERAALDLD